MINHQSIEFRPTGDISRDVPNFLALFGYHKTAEHCAFVAAKSKELALNLGVDPIQAEQAGYLHDISAVIPNQEKIEYAHTHQVDVLEQESQAPMIIHQKLSVVMAREIFGVTDLEVLSAIGCHTTLKANASSLDKVVFLADKIAWDQAGRPPYINEVNNALEESLDAAVLAYLDYLWDRRDQILIIHPWFIEAREELLQNLQSGSLDQ